MSSVVGRIGKQFTSYARTSSALVSGSQSGVNNWYSTVSFDAGNHGGKNSEGRGWNPRGAPKAIVSGKVHQIPNNKRIEYSLQCIHGIGRAMAKQILCDLSLENKITKDLSEYELVRVRDEVSKYTIEGDLPRFDASAIKRLKEIQCYRGVRHIEGLPCRGQRTKTNCGTLKGKKVAIAGKKTSRYK